MTDDEREEVVVGPEDIAFLRDLAGFEPPDRPHICPCVRVVITGSREWSWAHKDRIRLRLAQLPPGTEIIVGDAPLGVDPYAALCGRAFGFKVRVFEADWKRYGRTFAGHERNLRMLDEEPGLVIAFWNGKSTGTKGCIDEARHRGIPVDEVNL